MPDFVLMDPLTLLGKETLAELARRNFDFDQLALMHSLDVEESQVTAAGGHAMLVSRLEDTRELQGCRALILCSDVENERLEFLDRFLEVSPELVFVDASSISRYRNLGQALASGRHLGQSTRFRLASPALVMAVTLMDVLWQLEPRSLNLTALQPVSAIGRDGIEILARQSIQRLQGENISGDEDVLAFNVTVDTEAAFSRDAEELFPGLETLVSLATGSCFHGHWLQLLCRVEEKIGVENVESAIRSSDRLRYVELPMNLNMVVDGKEILVGGIQVSPDGTHVQLQAMADGTRVAGGSILADILEQLY